MKASLFDVSTNLTKTLAQVKPISKEARKGIKFDQVMDYSVISALLNHLENIGLTIHFEV